ncbi:MAG: hypothetical protein HQL73_07990 [Magnetococcales bacterium]|nr:hypothetical protein [Magnetococcales bacterium]
MPLENQAVKRANNASDCLFVKIKGNVQYRLHACRGGSPETRREILSPHVKSGQAGGDTFGCGQLAALWKVKE